jgi:two-component system LytT family response regulator
MTAESEPVGRLRVVIADDEPLARARLRDFISRRPELQLAAEAADGSAALRLIEDLHPDIAFLDIRMPKLNGVDVAASATAPLIAVFTTAYDSFAVAAFELGAADYLLKPFGRERFDRAVDRILAGPGGGCDLPQRLAIVRAALRDEKAPAHIYIRDGARIDRIDIADIEHVEGHGDYILIHAGDIRRLARIRMHHFEARLGPASFARIHRSHIVNLDAVRSARSLPGGRMRVTLRSGAQVEASRAGARILRERLRG